MMVISAALVNGQQTGGGCPAGRGARAEVANIAAHRRFHLTGLRRSLLPGILSLRDVDASLGVYGSRDGKFSCNCDVYEQRGDKRRFQDAH